jgi:hypothetical protein
VVVRKAISRRKFLEWFANLEPCLVAMEACSAAHYWGRKLHVLGHKVCLTAPQFAGLAAVAGVWSLFPYWPSMLGMFVPPIGTVMITDPTGLRRRG